MNGPERSLDTPFGRQMQADQDAGDYYRRLSEGSKLRSAVASEYRCAKGCLLLHIFRTPNGLAFYIPAYKLPPQLNTKSSSESGRKANTVDGDRKWKSRAALLRSAINLDLNCEHVRLRVVELDTLEVGQRGQVRRVIVPID